MTSASIVIESLLPISVETLSSLSDEEMAHLDRFIYRFTKAQDSMSRRFLPSLYFWLEDDTNPRPFLDVLHRLEQLGILSDITTWQTFRNLRNSLAHDYPESQRQTVATINELFASWGDFVGLYQKARDYFTARSQK